MTYKIAIVGTVGIGKTTVTKELERLTSQKNINAHFFEEKEKYTYLKKAYDDMSKYAFILQMDFLMSRLRMVNNESVNEFDFVFYDRSYVDDYFYAERSHKAGELTDEEFEIYKIAFDKFHKITQSDGNELDVIIILQQPESGLANLRRTQRDRFDGREVDREHFNEIDEWYDSEESIDWAKCFAKNVFNIKNTDSKETAHRIIKLINGK